jgi:hypothetical protein
MESARIIAAYIYASISTLANILAAALYGQGRRRRRQKREHSSSSNTPRAAEMPCVVEQRGPNPFIDFDEDSLV